MKRFVIKIMFRPRYSPKNTVVKKQRFKPIQKHTINTEKGHENYIILGTSLKKTR